MSESQNHDKIVSRARPIFLYIIYIMILFSIPFGILKVFEPVIADKLVDGVSTWLKSIPDDLWWLFGAGYLGYTGARSFDKFNKNK